MKACIYARTCAHDKSHNMATITRQVEDARELAHQRNIRVAYKSVYTDVDCDGHLLPTQWAGNDEPVRPALSAMISAIVNREVERVIVRQMERLATTSELLLNLCDLFKKYNVKIIPTRTEISEREEPSEAFAASILKPVILFRTDEEIAKRAEQRVAKMKEIERLQIKLNRLEAEVAELSE